MVVQGPVSRVCSSRLCDYAGRLQAIDRFGRRAGFEGKDGYAVRCLVCERKASVISGRSRSYNPTPGRLVGERQYRWEGGVKLSRCSKCGEWLRLDCFVRDRNSVDGYKICCLLCNRIAARDRRRRSGEAGATVRNTEHGRAHREPDWAVDF